MGKIFLTNNVLKKMQNTNNGDIEEEKNIARQQDAQQDTTARAMPVATAGWPRAAAFPQPPVGAFDLYGPNPGWNNQMINQQNWNEMMR